MIYSTRIIRLGLGLLYMFSCNKSKDVQLVFTTLIDKLNVNQEELGEIYFFLKESTLLDVNYIYMRFMKYYFSRRDVVESCETSSARYLDIISFYLKHDVVALIETNITVKDIHWKTITYIPHIISLFVKKKHFYRAAILDSSLMMKSSSVKFSNHEDSVDGVDVV